MRRVRPSCFLLQHQQRSAYPSACVTIAAAIRPLRFSKVLIGERVHILPVEQRFLVYYCNTLIREIDPATRRSAIIDRYVAAPPARL